MKGKIEDNDVSDLKKQKKKKKGRTKSVCTDAVMKWLSSHYKKMQGFVVRESDGKIR